MPSSAILRHRTTAIRTFFSFSSSFTPKPSPTSPRKPPLLWKPEDPNITDAIQLEVLSWGRGSSGQLGIGNEETRIYPTPAFSLLVPPSFRLSQSPGFLSPPEPLEPALEVGISCGLFHSAALVGGQFWIWGKGDGGRLGFGNENPAFLPTLNPHLGNVKCLALGGLHSVALTSLGQVFTWGYGGFGALGHSVYTRELVPRLVEGSWTVKIKHIATSGTHTASITESGELFSWGREEGDGRLGLGPGRGPDQAGGLSIPCKVKALPVPVDAVACGGFFTLALTEQGQLWSWGEDGKVLSWGHGGHGQLGHSSIQNQKVPTMIEALADERIVSVACGGSSSAAVTETGKLYMWGNAKDSQLGVPGLPEIQPSPIEIKFLMEDDGLGPHKVLSVAIGASHAMCLVSR
ncbi:hypothetical protein Cgig2_029695 [Carnegiea gigantea]|uniref:Ultraviolet-B receptor UVR8 n=1 Tax=Carnegiea gigantea TaxID=171969 RepID=A0A9Q1QJ90_9CARY|nr:hypothetical protein Cgig2_029695 [Carnegiea gigantea]